MKLHALTDAQWERVSPLLPPQKPATGRPAKDHRTILDAILWHQTSGRPWRDLPERFGPWQTVYTRLRRWQRAGVWDRVIAVLHAEATGDGDHHRPLQLVEAKPASAPSSALAAVPVAASRSTPRSGGSPSRWTTW
jgi:transposase